MITIISPLIIALVLSSCSTVSDIPQYTEKYIIDFSPYSDSGFFITPHDYNGTYTSIGLIDIAVFPHAKDVGTEKAHKVDENKYLIQGSWVTEKIPLDDVVQKAYKEAIKMGADAIIDFKLTTTSKSYPLFNHYGIQITGYAIKRNY